MTSVLPIADASFVTSVSPAMVALEAAAAEIAGTNIPILLLGEIGTGKEVLARRVHELSPYREGPFARIACGSITAERFLDDLGLSGPLGAPKAGSLLFDEIAELDPACQRKLLLSLPEGDSGAGLKARVISTSSRNLEEEMRAGRFRTELYYRLNAVCLRLLPLRERKSDIPLLVDHFMAKHASELRKPAPRISAKFLEKLMDYSWPGNVRELENVVRKTVALSDESLALAELGGSASHPIAPSAAPVYSLKAAARAASREAERELILKALARTRWNRKRAAQALQISYKSLLYKLKQIGLQETEIN